MFNYGRGTNVGIIIGCTVTQRQTLRNKYLVEFKKKNPVSFIMVGTSKKEDDNY